jgi:hypothetical protein
VFEYLGVVGEDVQETLLALPAKLDAEAIHQVEVLEHQARHRRVQFTRKLQAVKFTV